MVYANCHFVRPVILILGGIVHCTRSNVEIKFLPEAFGIRNPY